MDLKIKLFIGLLLILLIVLFSLSVYFKMNPTCPAPKDCPAPKVCPQCPASKDCPPPVVCPVCPPVPVVPVVPLITYRIISDTSKGWTGILSADGKTITWKNPENNTTSDYIRIGAPVDDKTIISNTKWLNVANGWIMAVSPPDANGVYSWSADSGASFAMVRI